MSLAQRRRSTAEPLGRMGERRGELFFSARRSREVEKCELITGNRRGHQEANAGIREKQWRAYVNSQREMLRKCLRNSMCS